MPTNHNNVCAVFHEPDTVTITINYVQMKMLRTIADIARQDECENDQTREEIADFAQELYKEIGEEMKAHGLGDLVNGNL